MSAKSATSTLERFSKIAAGRGLSEGEREGEQETTSESAPAPRAPRAEPAEPGAMPRAEKPVRITIDLAPAQQRALKLWVTEREVTIAEVVRTLIGHVLEDEELEREVLADVAARRRAMRESAAL